MSNELRYIDRYIYIYIYIYRERERDCKDSERWGSETKRGREGDIGKKRRELYIAKRK